MGAEGGGNDRQEIGAFFISVSTCSFLKPFAKIQICIPHYSNSLRRFWSVLWNLPELILEICRFCSHPLIMMGVGPVFLTFLRTPLQCVLARKPCEQVSGLHYTGIFS